jgi:hypothetical protein
MAGQESSSADNQSSITIQKPNIRTAVQRCSVSPKQKPKERTEVDVYSVAPAIAKYPCCVAFLSFYVMSSNYL